MIRTFKSNKRKVAKNLSKNIVYKDNTYTEKKSIYNEDNIDYENELSSVINKSDKLINEYDDDDDDKNLLDKSLANISFDNIDILNKSLIDFSNKDANNYIKNNSSKKIKNINNEDIKASNKILIEIKSKHLVNNNDTENFYTNNILQVINYNVYEQEFIKKIDKLLINSNELSDNLNVLFKILKEPNISNLRKIILNSLNNELEVLNKENIIDKIFNDKNSIIYSLYDLFNFDVKSNFKIRDFINNIKLLKNIIENYEDDSFSFVIITLKNMVNINNDKKIKLLISILFAKSYKIYSIFFVVFKYINVFSLYQNNNYNKKYPDYSNIKNDIKKMFEFFVTLYNNIFNDIVLFLNIFDFNVDNSITNLNCLDSFVVNFIIYFILNIFNALIEFINNFDTIFILNNVDVNNYINLINNSLNISNTNSSLRLLTSFIKNFNHPIIIKLFKLNSLKINNYNNSNVIAINLIDEYNKIINTIYNILLNFSKRKYSIDITTYSSIISLVINYYFNKDLLSYYVYKTISYIYVSISLEEHFDVSQKESVISIITCKILDLCSMELENFLDNKINKSDKIVNNNNNNFPNTLLKYNDFIINNYDNYYNIFNFYVIYDNFNDTYIKISYLTFLILDIFNTAYVSNNHNSVEYVTNNLIKLILNININNALSYDNIINNISLNSLYITSFLINDLKKTAHLHNYVSSNKFLSSLLEVFNIIINNQNLYNHKDERIYNTKSKKTINNYENIDDKITYFQLLYVDLVDYIINQYIDAFKSSNYICLNSLYCLDNSKCFFCKMNNNCNNTNYNNNSLQSISISIECKICFSKTTFFNDDKICIFCLIKDNEYVNINLISIIDKYINLSVNNNKFKYYKESYLYYIVYIYEKYINSIIAFNNIFYECYNLNIHKEELYNNTIYVINNTNEHFNKTNMLNNKQIIESYIEYGLLITNYFINEIEYQELNLLKYNTSNEDINSSKNNTSNNKISKSNNKSKILCKIDKMNNLKEDIDSIKEIKAAMLFKKENFLKLKQDLICDNISNLNSISEINKKYISMFNQNKFNKIYKNLIQFVNVLTYYSNYVLLKNKSFIINIIKFSLNKSISCSFRINCINIIKKCISFESKYNFFTYIKKNNYSVVFKLIQDNKITIKAECVNILIILFYINEVNSNNLYNIIKSDSFNLSNSNNSIKLKTKIIEVLTKVLDKNLDNLRLIINNNKFNIQQDATYINIKEILNLFSKFIIENKDNNSICITIVNYFSKMFISLSVKIKDNCFINDPEFIVFNELISNIELSSILKLENLTEDMFLFNENYIDNASINYLIIYLFIDNNITNNRLNCYYYLIEYVFNSSIKTYFDKLLSFQFNKSLEELNNYLEDCLKCEIIDSNIFFEYAKKIQVLFDSCIQYTFKILKTSEFLNKLIHYCCKNDFNCDLVESVINNNTIKLIIFIKDKLTTKIENNYIAINVSETIVDSIKMNISLAYSKKLLDKDSINSINSILNSNIILFSNYVDNLILFSFLNTFKNIILIQLKISYADFLRLDKNNTNISISHNVDSTHNLNKLLSSSSFDLILIKLLCSTDTYMTKLCTEIIMILIECNIIKPNKYLEIINATYTTLNNLLKELNNINLENLNKLYIQTSNKNRLNYSVKKKKKLNIANSNIGLQNKLILNLNNDNYLQNLENCFNILTYGYYVCNNKLILYNFFNNNNNTLFNNSLNFIKFCFNYVLKLQEINNLYYNNLDCSKINYLIFSIYNVSFYIIHSDFELFNNTIINDYFNNLNKVIEKTINISDIYKSNDKELKLFKNNKNKNQIINTIYQLIYPLIKFNCKLVKSKFLDQFSSVYNSNLKSSTKKNVSKRSFSANKNNLISNKKSIINYSTPIKSNKKLAISNINDSNKKSKIHMSESRLNNIEITNSNNLTECYSGISLILKHYKNILIEHMLDIDETIRYKCLCLIELLLKNNNIDIEVINDSLFPLIADTVNCIRLKANDIYNYYLYKKSTNLIFDNLNSCLKSLYLHQQNLLLAYANNDSYSNEVKSYTHLVNSEIKNIDNNITVYLTNKYFLNDILNYNYKIKKNKKYCSIYINKVYDVFINFIKFELNLESSNIGENYLYNELDYLDYLSSVVGEFDYNLITNFQTQEITNDLYNLFSIEYVCLESIFRDLNIDNETLIDVDFVDKIILNNNSQRNSLFNKLTTIFFNIKKLETFILLNKYIKCKHLNVFSLNLNNEDCHTKIVDEQHKGNNKFKNFITFSRLNSAFFNDTKKLCYYITKLNTLNNNNSNNKENLYVYYVLDLLYNKKFNAISLLSKTSDTYFLSILKDISKSKYYFISNNTNKTISDNDDYIHNYKEYTKKIKHFLDDRLTTNNK